MGQARGKGRGINRLGPKKEDLNFERDYEIELLKSNQHLKVLREILDILELKFGF